MIERRWATKRVGDLEPGDRIEGYGPVRYLEWQDGYRFPQVIVWTDEEGCETGWSHGWPEEALVKVAVPMVARRRFISYASDLGFTQWVRVPFYAVSVCYDSEDDPDEVEVALFRIARHADEYAERLNADRALIDEALAEARKQKPRSR